MMNTPDFLMAVVRSSVVNDEMGSSLQVLGIAIQSRFQGLGLFCRKVRADPPVAGFKRSSDPSRFQGFIDFFNRDFAGEAAAYEFNELVARLLSKGSRRSCFAKDSNASSADPFAPVGRSSRDSPVDTWGVPRQKERRAMDETIGHRFIATPRSPWLASG